MSHKCPEVCDGRNCEVIDVVRTVHGKRPKVVRSATEAARAAQAIHAIESAGSGAASLIEGASSSALWLAEQIGGYSSPNANPQGIADKIENALRNSDLRGDDIQVLVKYEHCEMVPYWLFWECREWVETEDYYVCNKFFPNQLGPGGIWIDRKKPIPLRDFEKGIAACIQAAKHYYCGGGVRRPQRRAWDADPVNEEGIGMADFGPVFRDAARRAILAWLLLVGITCMCCSCDNKADPVGHSRRLRLTLEQLQVLRKSPFWRDFRDTVAKGLELTQEGTIPRRPFLLTAYLIRAERDAAEGFLGLMWLKKEKEVNRSTVVQVCLQVGSGPDRRTHTIPLSDESALTPQGYWWSEQIRTKVVAGDSIRYEIVKAGPRSPAANETRLIIGEQLLKKGIHVSIRDKAGKASNSMLVRQLCTQASRGD
ncbi:MAG: hypothetical protein DRI01_10045 [Chloroflexi bacterium]|nr:MAG: hypothetical protein DRI01_10045 [Chloroflexota bacterium]